MSRAFVKENDSWDYCPKAGDTCFFAETGRECKRQECEYVSTSDTAPIDENADDREGG